MGVINIPGGGGAGILSEELGATEEFVLNGLKYVGLDTDDDVGVGAMPNIGAQSAALNCGGSVTISKGYHDGTGKITANSLASQTDATGSAARILKGYTAWVNGVKVTGTVEVSSIPSFSVAAYSTSQLTFTWKNPAQASGRPFSGVIICCKTGSYPTGPTDGFKYMGTGSNSAAGGTSSVTLSGFTAGTTYYCRIWAYCVCSAGNYTINSTKVLVSSGYASATGKPTTAGSQTFKASDTFTVPANVRKIDVFCVGGGGSGGYGDSGMADAYKGKGGGGGGYTAYKLNIPVTPGDTYVVTIGAGGEYNKNGGTTSFADLVSAAGGTTSVYITSSSRDVFGGNGGSGGGRGGYDYDSGSETEQAAGNGGSNGGNGGGAGYSTSKDKHYGKGQGTTTRAFGESSGTLCSGGGGGGYGDATTGQGSGGSGGGGAGGSTNTLAVSGTANTGGGGGGGGGKNGYETPGKGGSGVCIVRWK